MAFKEDMRAGVSILELKGKLMGAPETTEIHQRVKELVANGVKKVVIDLGGVTWMNSSGIGMLMSALSTVRNAGGELKVARATEKVKSLFIITKIITTFEHYDSVEEAVASFNQ